MRIESASSSKLAWRYQVCSEEKIGQIGSASLYWGCGLPIAFVVSSTSRIIHTSLDRQNRTGADHIGHHNRPRDMAQLAVARSLVQRQYFRLTEVMDFGQQKYGAAQEGLMGDMRGAAGVSAQAKA